MSPRESFAGQSEETGSVLASQLPLLAFAFVINYIYESCNYLITSPLWLPLTSRIHHGPVISFKLPMNLSP